MTYLSPAAQAVMAAYGNSLTTEPYTTSGRIEIAVAAALRAVADHAQRSSYAAAPSTDWGDGWKSGVNDTAQGLLAIAAELEAQ